MATDDWTWDEDVLGEREDGDGEDAGAHDGDGQDAAVQARAMAHAYRRSALLELRMAYAASRALSCMDGEDTLSAVERATTAAHDAARRYLECARLLDGLLDDAADWHTDGP